MYVWGTSAVRPQYVRQNIMGVERVELQTIL